MQTTLKIQAAVAAMVALATGKADGTAAGGKLIDNLRAAAITAQAEGIAPEALAATFEFHALRNNVAPGTIRPYAQAVQGYALIVNNGGDILSGGGKKKDRPLPKEDAIRTFTASQETEGERAVREAKEKRAAEVKEVMERVKHAATLPTWGDTLAHLLGSLEAAPDAVKVTTVTKAEREKAERLRVLAGQIITDDAAEGEEEGEPQREAVAA